MRIDIVFRLVLALQLVLLISTVIVDSYLVSHLPDILQKYFLVEEQKEISSYDVLFFLVIYPVLLLHYASVIGLFFLKKWAKWVYIATTVVIHLPDPYLGPTVQHSVVTTLSSLDSISVGFILAALLLTKVVPEGKHA